MCAAVDDEEPVVFQVIDQPVLIINAPAVFSGEKTKAEKHGAKEIAIFKDGVTL